MNVNMWENAATQENVQTLRPRGVRIVEPDSGYLACGMIGPGRLAANETIVHAVLEALGADARFRQAKSFWSPPDQRASPLHPVRYIGNRSSGKMGYAIAEAALRRGAKVDSDQRPTALKPPSSAEVVLCRLLSKCVTPSWPELDRATIVIKAAAVSDFTVRAAADEKVSVKAR